MRSNRQRLSNFDQSPFVSCEHKPIPSHVGGHCPDTHVCADVFSCVESFKLLTALFPQLHISSLVAVLQVCKPHWATNCDLSQPQSHHCLPHQTCRFPFGCLKLHCGRKNLYTYSYWSYQGGWWAIICPCLAQHNNSWTSTSPAHCTAQFCMECISSSSSGIVKAGPSRPCTRHFYQ